MTYKALIEIARRSKQTKMFKENRCFCSSNSNPKLFLTTGQAKMFYIYCDKCSQHRDSQNLLRELTIKEYFVLKIL